MSGYIGTQPVPQATQTRQTFTATASQTSFATGGYQAGYLDVFLNGVKLVDGTDYTATNGSDVVLTTGAASGDTLEVVAYTAFEVLNQNFTGGVTVDNDGATVLTVDRATSDGTIIDVQKDGTSVGSIQSRAGVVSTIILDPRTAGAGLTGAGDGSSNRHIVGTNESGAEVDGGVNLGKAGVRFKDLYLSGGVYLGGTGSANKLDDYEEGTWTPTLGGTATYNHQIANYTKVGRVVTVHFDIDVNAIGSGSTAQLSGLPFTSQNIGAPQVGAVTYFEDIATACVFMGVYIDNNAQTMQFTGGNSSATTISRNAFNVFGNNTRVIGTVTYMTN